MRTAPRSAQPNRATHGLVLQGGGARGAYQVGALKAIAEIFGRRRNPFPVITGASVGAINAAPLAAASTDFRVGVAQLEKLWRGLTCDMVFETNAKAIAASSARWLWTIAFGGLGLGDPVALLDNSPLGELLDREFDPETLARALRSGAVKALAISASSYRAGSSVTFFQGGNGKAEWDRARRFGREAKIDARHLLASSALPFVFPAVEIDGAYFGDGALRLSAPLSPAIQLGADRLLVIGVRDKTVPAPNEEKEVYPTIGEMTGHALDIIFNDDLDVDIERLERINRVVRAMGSRASGELGLQEIRMIVLQPSADLREVARRHEQEMPGTIRMLFKSIGAWGKDGRLVSYLLFEPGYIGELIDLAYADTMKRRDEIMDHLIPQSVTA